ncbi:SRPBCC domain-containing protein [Planotetraspora sp. A-T 1434]|uniref:SRPBCC family protein n=1 Tax=Planotetraspora sp. A-T 1434 TaxID=2979219 RepID=UPI0021BF17AB|nr:SRPBCC domain-containing protein [Planotetraspora sp. A-T 1434]MCT9933186.1 SRPBCC domain-containing protein [Planotetraspora sp. A-T 1434]
MTELASGRIEITRTFDAPRELVYSAWTEPKHFTHWWGAPLDTISMDVRPGGEWKATIVVDEQTQVPFAGVYREVVPNERLVYTLVDLSGREDPRDEPGEEVVTVTFRSIGDGTELVFLQEGNLPEAELPRAEEGWGHFFDALDDHLKSVK